MSALPVRRVALAEDDDTLRDILRRTLEAEGFRVESFARGDEALERCRTEAPDLIVTDILMPGLHGTELLERLRQQKIDVPVLVISSDIDEGARRRLDGHTGVAVLQKPFSLGGFQAAIRSLLGEAQAG